MKGKDNWSKMLKSVGRLNWHNRLYAFDILNFLAFGGGEGKKLK